MYSVSIWCIDSQGSLYTSVLYVHVMFFTLMVCFSGALLVTDALAAMGLPDGTHLLGTHTVEVKDGAARLTGTNTLAGR